MSQQAKKMLKTSNQQFVPATFGDCVAVPVPSVDKGRIDSNNIIGKIISINTEGMYKIGTSKGTLDKLYARSQFQVLPEQFITDEEIVVEPKSLRTIASQLSQSGGQGVFRCDCKSKCDTKRCKCKKLGALCNSRCHNSLSCSNK